VTKSNVFTAVYRNVTNDEAGEITCHPKWSAGSWSHALDARNEVAAALATANARIIELEASLQASRRAALEEAACIVDIAVTPDGWSNNHIAEAIRALSGPTET
jgi:hypothetical protein